MKQILFLFFFLLFSGCSKELITMKIDFTENEGLFLSLSALRDTSIFIDLKAFTPHCLNQENNKEIKDINLDQISSSLSYNQVLVVDQNNNTRFLTNYFALSNEVKNIPSINCSEEWIAKIDLKKNHDEKLLINIEYISDLMVNEASSRVKLIYISRKISDFNKSLIVESNWIKLPR